VILLQPDHFSPSLGPGPTPKLPLPPPQSQPALPSSGSAAVGGPGLPPPPSSASSSHTSYPVTGPSSDSIGGTLVPIGNSSGPGGSSTTGGFPDDLDIHNYPPELKKEGSDWFAIFNPKVKRVLDVSLVHTLMHERLVWLLFSSFSALKPSFDSVVCCVRFSSDGKYLATGCNRTAQIYDTKTGAKTWFV
jgi:glucose repression regulatory protein TUP1